MTKIVRQEAEERTKEDRAVERVCTEAQACCFQGVKRMCKWTEDVAMGLATALS